MFSASGSYSLTASLSTTPVIEFGQLAAVAFPQEDLGNTTVYGSTEKDGTYGIIQVAGADAVLDLSADVTALPDEVLGVPFLKLVSTNPGVCKISITK